MTARRIYPVGSVQNRPKALVVVCHWDDEVISAWGAMCRYDCTVLCLTDKYSPEYQEIFNKVVESVRGQPMSWMVPLKTANGRHSNLHTAENVARLAQVLSGCDYRLCFSHHFNCDIGRHPQHLMAANLCYEAIRVAGFKDKVRLFGFGSDRHVSLVRLPEAIWYGRNPLVLDITPEENAKRFQFARMYKHDFEERYPIILESAERQFPVTVRGMPKRLWLWTPARRTTTARAPPPAR